MWHVLEVWQFKRWNWKLMFAIDVQRCLARNKNFKFRSCSQHLRHDVSYRDEVFKVIEQQEHRLAQAAQVLHQSVLWRLATGLPDANHLRDRGRNQSWLANRR